MTHPNGDDIAACLISFDPREYSFNHVSIKSFATRDVTDEYGIGPGDEVFMVGRFINHEGRQLNLPTARSGNIGQMPWESIRQDNGFEQESYLIEMRSIGGYSGSPIFVQIPLGEPVNPNPNAMQVLLNTGMSAVVPAWKLAELLNFGTLAEHREAIVQSVLRREADDSIVH